MILEFEYVGFVLKKLVETMLRNRINCKYVVMLELSEGFPVCMGKNDPADTV